MTQHKTSNNKNMNYLEQISTTPEHVQAIVSSFDCETNDPYRECERVVAALALIGWDADYGLDGELTDLQPAKRITVFYSFRENNDSWNRQPQHKIENVSWDCGVFIIRALLQQKKDNGEITEARICNSFGFNNNGSYIHATQL
jgi:hypothetical protein